VWKVDAGLSSRTFVNCGSVIMELPVVMYEKQEYIETASGNKVSRRSVLCGAHNIVLNGKTIIQSGAIVRGDLANIRVGRRCVISRNVVIRPAYKKITRGLTFFPQQIGDHVFIGEGSVISAQNIGSYVYIGKNCVIGRRAVLRDCCMIADNSIVSPETVVPSFAIYEGNPARYSRELPGPTQDIMVDHTNSYYQNFVPIESSGDRK